MSRTSKVRTLYNPEKASPFQVNWRIDGKRYSRFFPNEKEQEEFVSQMSPYIEGDKSDILKLDSTTSGDVIAVNKIRGKVSFMEMWRFYEKHHKEREVYTLWQGADTYIRSLRQQNLNESYIIHARRIMERLCEAFGDTLLTEIKRENLELWLDKLPYSPVTKRNYRSTIRAAWTFFERKEWIEKNIAVALKCPKILKEEIGILSVQEAEQLLRANENEDREICGLLALGLFAGMRSSAIPRVEFEEINFKIRGILTPAGKTKKGRRNYIEKLPDNLWAWLERTPKTAFGWNDRKFKKRKECAFRRAELLVSAHDIKKLAKKGIKASLKLPPHNAMRHSFASYHVAWKREFQDTALIMSHKNTGILFDHYRGIATQTDAEKYFNIYPKM